MTDSHEEPETLIETMVQRILRRRAEIPVQLYEAWLIQMGYKHVRRFWEIS